MASSKATEKFTADCMQSLKSEKKDTVSTVIVRTKLKANSKNEAQMAVKLLEFEHMATRRRQLLARVRSHYGEGKEFCKNYQESRIEGQDTIMKAAPNAVNLWLSDTIAVSGTRAEIEELAEHPEVQSIEVNRTFQLPRVMQTPPEDTPEIVDGSAWGLAKVQANETWGGYGRGRGVLVGHLDTGVDDSHPALANKVAAFEEFDSLGNPVGSAAHDSGSHGTHTAGTICGRTFNGVNIGVAPEARLASALVLPGGGGTFAQIIAGMQWCIGQNVDVINMSLGGQGYSTLWNLPVLVTTFSGVLVVASVGNSGHGTSGGPGNDFLALGVGATHYEDSIAGFSGGETLINVPWLFFNLTYMKPDISAPGVSVLSSVPGPGLAAFNGTSMAAPHVAGGAALLISAEPSLQGDPFAIRTILIGAGREDLGEAGRDQRFGFGRLDALSAAETAVSMAP